LYALLTDLALAGRSVFKLIAKAKLKIEIANLISMELFKFKTRSTRWAEEGGERGLGHAISFHFVPATWAKAGLALGAERLQGLASVAVDGERF
jgi:hypothetical protein